VITLTLSTHSRDRSATLGTEQATPAERMALAEFARLMHGAPARNGYVFTEARGRKVHTLIAAGFHACDDRRIRHPKTGRYQWSPTTARAVAKIILP